MIGMVVTKELKIKTILENGVLQIIRRCIIFSNTELTAAPLLSNTYLLFYFLSFSKKSFISLIKNSILKLNIAFMYIFCLLFDHVEWISWRVCKSSRRLRTGDCWNFEPNKFDNTKLSKIKMAQLQTADDTIICCDAHPMHSESLKKVL